MGTFRQFFIPQDQEQFFPIFFPEFGYYYGFEHTEKVSTSQDGGIVFDCDGSSVAVVGKGDVVFHRFDVQDVKLGIYFNITKYF